ncbi:MAG: TRAP transporter small permease subunit [Rhodobacteraceae bacterium]|nr:TRAP transporter small permease subunit [Paracoccaceae bacterium]
MRAAIRWLDRISAFADRIALSGAVLAVAALVFLAGWQAAARYLLDQPPAWTEELARFTMVWAGLLGASCAFRAHVDPSLFPEARARQGGVGKLFASVRAAGAIIFITPILWFSIFGLNGRAASGYIARNAKQMAETVDLPMSVFAMAVPLGFGLILLHAVAHLGMALTAEHKT